MTLGDFVVTRDLDSVECDLGVTLDVLAESMRTNPEPGGRGLTEKDRVIMECTPHKGPS